MKIRVDRFEFSETSTISRLTCGGFSCFILEDVDRHLEDSKDGKEKVYGRTAIPRGTYEVIITYSNRFKRELPLLRNVKYFEGIRIHPGNSDVGTDGCLLPGSSYSADFVYNSRATFNKLFGLIEDALDRGDKVELEIL